VTESPPPPPSPATAPCPLHGWDRENRESWLCPPAHHTRLLVMLSGHVGTPSTAGRVHPASPHPRAGHLPSAARTGSVLLLPSLGRGPCAPRVSPLPPAAHHGGRPPGALGAGSARRWCAEPRCRLRPGTAGAVPGPAPAAPAQLLPAAPGLPAPPPVPRNAPAWPGRPGTGQWEGAQRLRGWGKGGVRSP